MTTSRLFNYAIGFTLFCIVFIALKGHTQGNVFWHLLVVQDMPAAWLMLAMLAFGYWHGKRQTDSGHWVEQLLLALDRQRYAVAIVLWAVLCAGSLWVYHNHPLSADEYSVVFQAKVFAAGAMHGQFPPDLLDALIPQKLQSQFLMVNRETGAVFTAYWPGFSLLLAPFAWLGIPWACNPTLVAASFLLIGRIARDLIDAPVAAGWALAFALASPAFVANGISYFSMPAHLLFNLAFAWLLLAPSPLRLFLAGLTGGFALVLHNPFPHAVFALPWIIWLATRRGQLLRNLGLLAAGYLPILLLLGVGWLIWGRQTLSESAQLMPVAQATAAVQAAGGGMQALLDRLQGHLLAFAGLVDWPKEKTLFARVGGLVKLWLWASPLLLLLAWYGWRREKSGAIRLMGASALLTFFAYFLFSFNQGNGWGYRYFHSAWGVLPVLATLGVIKLAAKDGTRVLGQVALLALLSLVAANALRFMQIDSYMAAHLAQYPPRVEAERRIVLHNGEGYKALDLIQNDPWLRGNEIVFLVRDEADERKILQRFPAFREASRNDYGRTLVERAGGN